LLFTPWLNVLLYLNIFPGIFMLIAQFIPRLQNKKAIVQHAYSMLVVLALSAITFPTDAIISLGIVIAVLLLFIVEYFFVRSRVFGLGIFTDVKNQISAVFGAFLILIIYPILEELLYRHYLYLVSTELEMLTWQYAVLSCLGFVFSHIIAQGVSGLRKTIFAILQMGVYLITLNVFICIVIHISFNVLIYLSRSVKYQQQRGIF